MKNQLKTAKLFNLRCRWTEDILMLECEISALKTNIIALDAYRDQLKIADQGERLLMREESKDD